MEVAFTARARVDFLFREVDVEREEDYEYDADTNHAPMEVEGGLLRGAGYE